MINLRDGLLGFVCIGLFFIFPSSNVVASSNVYYSACSGGWGGGTYCEPELFSSPGGVCSYYQPAGSLKSVGNYEYECTNRPNRYPTYSIVGVCDWWYSEDRRRPQPDPVNGCHLTPPPVVCPESTLEREYTEVNGVCIATVYSCPINHILKGQIHGRRYCEYVPPPLDPDDNAGPPGNGDGAGGDGEGGGGGSCQNPEVVGDPVNAGVGNKFEVVQDYLPAGASPLRLVRYYNSLLVKKGVMGERWRHYYERLIVVTQENDVKKATAQRPDGKVLTFQLVNGDWKAKAGFVQRLIPLTDGFGQLQGWRLITSSDGAETYDVQGRLIQITSRGGARQILSYGQDGKLNTVSDSFGRRLQFAYDGNGRLTTVTDPAGGQYNYGYDARDNLISFTGPDQKARTYHYEDARFPHALTSVIDENGARIESTTYDAQGRANHTERGFGVESTSIVYNDNGSAAVTDTFGVVRNYTFSIINGIAKSIGVTQPCATCGQVAQALAYDENGNVTSRTDFNGVRTTYTYDLSRNLEASRTEAIGMPVERTISTEWHTEYRLPIKITEPGRITELEYDANGNLISRKVTDAATNEQRIWQYEYGNEGLLLASITPDGAKASYDYDANGNLIHVTDANGLVTTYSEYDANGRVGKIAYPNGRVGSYVYDPRGRVLEQHEVVANPDLPKVNGDWLPSWVADFLNWLFGLFGESWPGDKGQHAYPELDYFDGTASTKYAYDAAGQLVDVTLPDGDTLHFEYDEAHRLVSTRDNLGNTISLTLDAMGNTTESQVNDASGVLVAKAKRVYDQLNRLQQIVGNSGQSLTYSYDDKGNLKEQVDALGRHTYLDYDALERETSQIDAAGNRTQYGYDALDQLLSITDARGVTTRYTRNAFGEATQEQSPDAGTTQRIYTQGRLASETDARGIVHQYQYDAAGRLIERKAGAKVVTFGYDDGEFGQGQLSRIADASGTLDYRYNSQGRVVEKLASLQQGPRLRVRYAYTLGGKLKQLATPGRHLVEYGYDTNGRVSGVKVDGQSLLDGIHFGASGIAGWTWANGSTFALSRDWDGRVTSLGSGTALARQYGYDVAGRITAITDTGAKVNDSYGYDPLDRLTSQQMAAGLNRYAYDAVGNRLERQSQAQGGVVQGTSYSYAPDSNRLQGETTGTRSQSYQYLPTGQITADGLRRYQYDDEGRLAQVSRGRVSLRNAYNALGQRVKKVGFDMLYYAYDEAGHLLGEYRKNGQMVREYVWLGDRLVGLLSHQRPHALLQVHTDHLGTPRAVSEGNTVLWRWEGEAFGDAEPTDGRGRVTGRWLDMPLRFPGQYYDVESGLSQNYYRDYNSAAGRYVQSDPIGLRGGLNTYAYVGGNPGRFVDSYGLLPGDSYPSRDAAGQAAVNDINSTSIQQNREYAGLIYRDQDGNSYSYGGPAGGTVDTSFPIAGSFPIYGIPDGTYHTHGANLPKYDNENFSHEDLNIWSPFTHQIYLGTPSGDVKSYTPGSGYQDNMTRGRCEALRH